MKLEPSLEKECKHPYKRLRLNEYGGGADVCIDCGAQLASYAKIEVLSDTQKPKGEPKFKAPREQVAKLALDLVWKLAPWLEPKESRLTRRFDAITKHDKEETK